MVVTETAIHVTTTRGLPFVAFLFASLCAVLPILSHGFLPLVDLPNHIARHHIAANGQGALAQYYTSVFSLIPNSAVDLMWKVSGFAGDPVVFSNYVMAFYAISFIASTMVLARVVQGHWTVWSAGVSLLVFNGPFFWGFQNFIVSVPFCILCLAIWLSLENKKLALRMACFFPLAAAIYLMHFFAFAILCIAVFGRELQVLMSEGGSLRGRISRLVLLMLPFAVPVLWLIFSILLSPPSEAGSRSEFGSVIHRFGAIISPFTAVNAGDVIQVKTLGYIAGLLVLLSFASMFLRQGPRLVMNGKLTGAIIALGVAALLAPTWLNGVALVHIRVPVVLVAVFFAATQWRDLDQRSAACLIFVVAALLCARSVYVEKFFSQYDMEMHDLLQATETLPEGSRVLPIRGPGWQNDLRLAHAQAFMVTKRDVFVPTLFLGVHTIKLNEKWSDYAHPALFAVDVRRILRQETHPVLPDTKFLDQWEQKFTHVLLLDYDRHDIHTDDRIELQAQVGRFSLYRVTQ